jgi:hypothetical protein
MLSGEVTNTNVIVLDLNQPSLEPRSTTLKGSMTCEWLTTDRGFSPSTPVSSANKIDLHDITEILLKVALDNKQSTYIAHNLHPVFSGVRVALYNVCRSLIVLLVAFFLLAITLSVLLWFTASNYLFGIFQLLAITLSVLWFTASDYLEVIRSRKSNKDRQCNGLKFEDTKEVIRRRKSNKDRQCNGLKFEDTKEVIRSRKSKERQCNAITLSLLLWFTASDYLFGIFKLLTITLSVLWFTASDYLFGIFKLLTITLSVLLWFTASDYLFGIFKLLTITLSVL